MIGALKHRLELLIPERTEDGGGGASLDWRAGPVLWAQVQRLTSTRDYAGERVNRLRRIAATIRHRRDIALGWRVRFEDAVYEIASMEDEGEGRRLTLICEEALS